MKKFFTLSLAVLLILGTFNGCDNKPAEDNSSKQDVSSVDQVSSTPKDSYISTEKKPYGIPEFTYGEASTFKQDDRYIIVANNTNAENYNEYLNKLIDKGYIKYAENKIEDNLYTTLTNKKTTVTVYCVPRTGITRVIAEPKGTMYPREKDNEYTSKDIQALYTTIQGDKTYVEYGMGHVIRLDDGSFIIIDGGTGGENHIDSNNLLKILEDQSPKDTKKIVIAAWIFTHPHGDHLGTFCTFAEDHRDKVKIEKFYYNFPSDKSESGQFSRVMKKYYSSAAKVTPHTGDKYYIRNAVIDMFFTFEDHFPRTIGGENSVGDANDASMMFKISIGAQSIFITGDAMRNSIRNIVTSYDTSFKSDFVQLAHHGLTNGYDLYVKVNPTYAFLPINHTRYSSFFAGGGGGHKGNMWLIETPSVRQIIPCGNGTVTIPIPYNPTNAEIMDKVPTPETVYKDYSYLY